MSSDTICRSYANRQRYLHALMLWAKLQESMKLNFFEDIPALLRQRESNFLPIKKDSENIDSWSFSPVVEFNWYWCSKKIQRIA